MNKVCPRCEIDQSTNSFYKNKARYDGLSSICKLCDNKRIKEYQLNTPRGHAVALKIRKKHRVVYRDKIYDYASARRLKNKQKAIELFGSKCLDCDKSFPSSVYDFHHLDPLQKEYAVASLFNLSWSKIEKELEKCILLCANCHRIRHHEQE